MLVDVKRHGLTGSKVSLLCDKVHITLNKNTIVGDKSAATPGGIRVGTPAITTRGYNEADCRQVAHFLHEVIQLSCTLQKRSGSKKLTDFEKELDKSAEVKDLAARVTEFGSQFPMPAFNTTNVA